MNKFVTLVTAIALLTGSAWADSKVNADESKASISTYTVTFEDEKPTTWDGSSKMNAEIKMGKIELVEEFRAEKNSLNVTIYPLTGVDTYTTGEGSSKQTITTPKFGARIQNRCSIAVGETCMAKDVNGKAIYIIARTH